MKIAIISLDQMIISYGVRLISSSLKKEGFQVKVIFARAIIGQPLSVSVENQIIKLCKDSDLVGLSLMSNHFPHAISLTKRIKKRLNVPVVWGGVHPTFCPEESLEYADMVCVGEGEVAMVELTKSLKRKSNNIKGIWIKNRGKIIRSNIQPLVEDLDSLPLPDFGPEEHFVRDGEKIKRMTNNLFRDFLTKRETAKGNFVAEYYISSSRGCPFRCAYCASNTVKGLYPKQKFFRLRSPDKVIEEVKELTKKFPFIKWIYFSDDDLLASPIGRVKNFCELWKKEIGLPFYATVAPWSYSEEKFKLFLDAGLGVINMGIQTVSKKGGEVYRRIFPKNKLKSIIKSIHKLNPPLPPLYDFILDNPYENDKDKFESLDFILSIPKPMRLQLFSLVPFPGTEIYSKMKMDGLLSDPKKMIYQKCYSYPEATYVNMLMFLASNNFPTNIINILKSEIFVLIFNSSIAKYILKTIPYSSFLVLARNLFNFRFWRFNITAKGNN